MRDRLARLKFSPVRPRAFIEHGAILAVDRIVVLPIRLRDIMQRLFVMGSTLAQLARGQGSLSGHPAYVRVVQTVPSAAIREPRIICAFGSALGQATA
jgi:hypothetical protein